MGKTTAEALWRLRLAGGIAWALPLYWLAVFPCARRELAACRRAARRIGDPELRGHALRKLEAECLTAEGAAAFAILAPLRAHRDVVRACVAYEVIFDYVDALGERPTTDPLSANRLLYRALDEAVCPGEPTTPSLRHHPDDGYLGGLVGACRGALGQLPARACVQDVLHRLALRAGEAQSLHHAAADAEGRHALARWALTQQPPGYALHWWELAAAAGSPLGVYALIAAAARQRTSHADARAVAQAYFPWIAALSWLLESLVDQQEDAATGASHSFIAHYGPPQSAARRLATIADYAQEDARRLPQAGRHALLLAGMAAMYLSHAGASSADAAEAAAAIRGALGWPVVPLLWALRLRRRLARSRASRRQAGDAAARRRLRRSRSGGSSSRSRP